jgi:hypothetical protein
MNLIEMTNFNGELVAFRSRYDDILYYNHFYMTKTTDGYILFDIDNKVIGVDEI